MQKRFISKNLLWILLAVVIVASTILPVRAEDLSTGIPQAVRDAADDPDARFLLAYRAAIFSDQRIYQVTSRNDGYYIAVSKDGQALGVRETPYGIKTFHAAIDPKVLDFFMSDRVLDYAGTQASVNAVYYLDGSTYDQGYVLVYDLINGPLYRLVYFYHPQIGEFLFPQHDFEDYQEAIRQDPQKRYGLYDLAPYDLNSGNLDLRVETEDNELPTHYLVLLSIGSLLLIGLIAVTLTWLHKKKAQHLEDPLVPLDIVCPPPGVPVMDPGDEIGVLNRP